MARYLDTLGTHPLFSLHQYGPQPLFAQGRRSYSHLPRPDLLCRPHSCDIRGAPQQRKHRFHDLCESRRLANHGNLFHGWLARSS